MTSEEWVKVVSVMQANWPHADIPEESLMVWYGDVQDLDVGQVRSAVAALCRDGREFPPNGGQIRAKVLAMSQAAEFDHGTAWGLVMQAVSKFGYMREQQALEWIEARSAITAESVRRFGWRSLCLYDLEAESTVRAQFRDVFKGVRRAAEHDTRYAGLEAGVRPKRLEPRSIKEIAREIVPESARKGLPEET